MKHSIIRRLFFLALAVGLPFVGSAQYTNEKDTSYANGYYVKRVQYFQSLPVQKRPIVFLGNSITEVGQWQDVTGMKNVINRGISGDNSFGVFYRLDDILVQRPRKIFIAIGVNDIKRGTPVEVIARNYERIIRKVQKEQPKTQLYLQSVLPVTESVLADIYNNIRNNRIMVLNALMKDLCVKYRVTYVDLYNNVFKDENGQLFRSLTTDGLHLQPEAYVLWANYLKKQKYL
ncbi:lysophospholipase L1-like esterase [Arcticibacter pallidicorallinus]|uniref:Lysophospholipase L1-like esterase n=1 Tax=Arcticibacter pallidicorallinus TaxID=1259464 RepID=A0A2T0U0P5_9SPHI|nr:GDSL-type esterase/lipase family protein [Arcticibacter pallidicorallinus]PRY51475.1 lysophospholipase L1-like esterase [Arcticibacter pallidicorallinus]